MRKKKSAKSFKIKETRAMEQREREERKKERNREEKRRVVQMNRNEKQLVRNTRLGWRSKMEWKLELQTFILVVF